MSTSPDGPVPPSIQMPPRPDLALGIVVAFAAVKLGLHIFTSSVTPYEFHRDEFLYFAMGEHLALFHMDFPPAMAVLAELVRGLLGDSLFAIRLVPAAFGTGTVVFASLIARELGGGRFAQGTAALCVLANPLFLRAGVLFQPVVVDQFVWTSGLYVLVRIATRDELRWWIALGVVAGVGLLTKFTIAVFGVSVAAGLFLTQGYSWLRKAGPWIALAIALTIGSPSIVGQIALDVPVLSYMADLRENQLARVTVWDFVTGQLTQGPTTLIAGAGVGFVFFSRSMARFRLPVWVVGLTFALLLVLKAKDYYLAPIYPLAYAAGAIWLGRLRLPRASGSIRVVALLLVIGFGALTWPLGLPILPPPKMAAYVARIGGESAVTTNVGAVERLPQDYADMLGWQDLVRAVRDVYHEIPADERSRTVIWASNYGEAGAIDFYGPRYGLPNAIAYVGTYWFYGPGGHSGDITIAVGFSQESLVNRFEIIEAAATVGHPYAVAEQRNQMIYIARRPYRTFQELWPEMRGRN